MHALNPILTVLFISYAASSPNMSIEDKMEVDGRSVFVGNVRTHS